MATPGLLNFHWARGAAPCAGESEIGDATFVAEGPDGLRALLVDVSGHGREAAALANRLVDLAARLFTDHDLLGVLDGLNEACRGTRGAACGVVYLERARGLLHFAALGNTRCVKVGWKNWRGIARDGLLGGRLPRLPIQTSPVEPQDTVVLFSDGIKERIAGEIGGAWQLLPASALVERLLTGKLRKTYDDAACVVIKCA